MQLNNQPQQSELRKQLYQQQNVQQHQDQQVLSPSLPLHIVRPFSFYGRCVWCIQKKSQKYIPLMFILCAAYPEYLRAVGKIADLLKMTLNVQFTYLSPGEEQAILEVYEKQNRSILCKMLIREDHLQAVMDAIQMFIIQQQI